MCIKKGVEFWVTQHQQLLTSDGGSWWLWVGVATRLPAWLPWCMWIIWSVYLCAVGWGSYFDHAVAWDKKMDDPNVKVITYEDMKQVRRRRGRLLGVCKLTRFNLSSPRRCLTGSGGRRAWHQQLLRLQPDGGAGAADCRGQHLLGHEAESDRLPLLHRPGHLQERWRHFSRSIRVLCC